MLIKLNLPALDELGLLAQEVIIPIVWSRDDKDRRTWRFAAEALKTEDFRKIDYIDLVYKKQESTYYMFAVVKDDDKNEVYLSGGAVKPLGIKFQKANHTHLFL